jgi:hypothetical protein
MTDISELLAGSGRSAEIVEDQIFLFNVWDYDSMSDLFKGLPNIPGIYAWYRHYHAMTDFSPDEVLSAINNSHHPVNVPRSPSRSLGSYDNMVFEVHSRNFEHFSSKSKLEGALKENIVNSHFSGAISNLFNLSILFTTPLYIGASIDLKSRIEDHIRGKTGLKSILQNGSTNTNKSKISNLDHNKFVPIDITKTKLLIICLEKEISPEDIGTVEKQDGEGEFNDGTSYKDPTQVLEEIAQRLFRPPFVSRIG